MSDDKKKRDELDDLFAEMEAYINNPDQHAPKQDHKPKQDNDHVVTVGFVFRQHTVPVDFNMNEELVLTEETVDYVIAELDKANQFINADERESLREAIANSLQEMTNALRKKQDRNVEINDKIHAAANRMDDGLKQIAEELADEDRVITSITYTVVKQDMSPEQMFLMSLLQAPDDHEGRMVADSSIYTNSVNFQHATTAMRAFTLMTMLPDKFAEIPLLLSLIMHPDAAEKVAYGDDRLTEKIKAMKSDLYGESDFNALRMVLLQAAVRMIAIVSDLNPDEMMVLVKALFGLNDDE